jgi:hypothetical protein
VLTALLFEWIEHRQATAGGQDEVFAGSTGMGRLLFERRRREVFVVTLVIALVAGLIGAGLFFSDEVEVVGILLLAAAGVALIVGWLVGRIAFRCYERGLARGNGGGEVRLSFEEIDELTYSAKRMFYKGSYVGTQLVLTFRGAAKKIKYSARIQNEDVDIDAIRDQVAQGIAARMLQQLRSGRPVTWMNDVVLLPEGLQFRRSKLFGLASGPVEVLLYGQIAGVGIAEGSMYLHNVAESQSVLSKPDSSPNFYPGYLALLRLWEVARLAGRQGSANP